METTIYFIIILHGLICAGFCSYVAGEKNRDSSGWFFLGLLFGIFALIAIAGVPSLSNNEQGDELSESIVDCDHLNQNGNYCEFCGDKI